MKEAPVTILVCEDDPDHRMLMLEALQDHLPDARFIEAENGAECIAMLGREHPQVLILDYRLGDMDGIEVLEQIADRSGRIAVLLVTSQGDEKIAVEAMKKGAADYVVKDTRMAFINHLPISVSQALRRIQAETEKMQALEKVRESEALNRTIIDQMMEAIVFVRVDGTILHLNKLACLLLGVDRDEVSNLSEMNAHPLVAEIQAQMGHLPDVSSKRMIESEFTCGEMTLAIRISPAIREKDQIDGVIIAISDITRTRKEEIERLEAINRTVFALAKAVELRDPYTAGHASNVVTIATAIAKRLNWDEKRIIGLKLAGELHDIGKIAIPAEILTRPTQLSPIERAMLKEHTENGYKILKDINFPFPVAEAVYQHHEVLDGSGYPRGLIGDQIIAEARILCVADVLDAITSHRPYRPGLGIDKAIEQLQKGYGTWYDSSVVDTILALIQEADGNVFWLSDAPKYDYRLREIRHESAYKSKPGDATPSEPA